MADYRIVLSQYNIPFTFGMFAHNMIAVIDNNTGQVIREFDGLATSEAGKVKAIGYLPSDTIQGYAFNYALYYDPSQAQVTLFEGNWSDVTARMGAMNAAIDVINQADYHYPFLGLSTVFGIYGEFNSNSVASTLIAAMGLDEPDVPNGAWFTPGSGKVILDQTTLDWIHSTWLGPQQTYDNYDQLYADSYYESYWGDATYVSEYAAWGEYYDTYSNVYYWDSLTYQSQPATYYYWGYDPYYYYPFWDWYAQFSIS